MKVQVNKSNTFGVEIFNSTKQGEKALFTGVPQKKGSLKYVMWDRRVDATAKPLVRFYVEIDGVWRKIVGGYAHRDDTAAEYDAAYALQLMRFEGGKLETSLEII